MKCFYLRQTSDSRLVVVACTTLVDCTRVLLNGAGISDIDSIVMEDVLVTIVLMSDTRLSDV